MFKIFLTLLVASVCHADMAESNPYPIRNHKMDFTKQFEYRLDDDHLISIRSLNENNLRTMIGGDLEPYPNALNWHPFDEVGYPYKKGLLWGRSSLLSKDEFISEIAVASEILVAVSNANRIYLYKPTVLERPIAWSDKLGSPSENELYLPADRRAWTFSCSVGDKDVYRVDFMDPSEVVAYHTDMNGNKFDFGFTATIYVLLGCGQRIVYWDTGLPPSFPRGFLTPFNGTTQGQSISAAGSTIFISVLDSSNTLRFFTRMYDYEINGACPGFTYTFSEEGEDRKIPLEGWREHATSEIAQEHLSALVSIHLTGQGNSSRELRIQGVDAEGRSGYYFKMIDDTSWQFQQDARLETSLQAPFPFNPDAPLLERNYEGEVIEAENSNFDVSLNSFHPFCTAEEPAVLSVRYQGETANINLHCVDGWNLVFHQKYHEDFIGVQEGEPKMLHATIVLTPEQLNCSKDSAIYNVIQNFLPYHKKVNSIQLVADNENVLLSSKDGKIKLFFSRSVTNSEIDASFYIKRAKAITAPDQNLDEQIDQCKMILSELIEIHDQYKLDAAKFLLQDLSAVLANPMVTVIFNFEVGDPNFEKAVADVKDPFKTQLRKEWSNLQKENQLFQMAVDILEERIKELEALSRS